jgi:hypothetical protein
MEPIMKTTTISISSILFAVAVLASGCHKAEPTDTNNMGPAQAAGKAVDDAGANAASATREAAADANAAADRAGEKIDAATDRAGEKIDAAGAEVRKDSKEAAADVKEGAKDATAATGRALERTGEKMQNASK